MKSGDEVDIKILRVDIDERKIGLSLKRAQRMGDDDEAKADAADQPPTKGGMDEHGALGTDKIEL